MRVAWVPLVLALSLLLAASPQAAAGDDCPGTYYTITPELSGRIEICPGTPPATPDDPTPVEWLPPLELPDDLADEPPEDLGGLFNATADPTDPPVTTEACNEAWGTYVWVDHDWALFTCVRVDVILPDGPLLGPVELETEDCSGDEEGAILVTPVGAYGACMTRAVTDRGPQFGVRPDECELESAPARDPAVYVLGYGVAICAGVVAEPEVPEQEPPGTGIDLTPCQPEAVDPVVRIGGVTVQICIAVGYDEHP